MVGSRHSQQEVSGEVHPFQRDFQATGQLQGNQRQYQRLPTLALQDLIEQRRMRAQRGELILLETQVVEVAQQRLRQFADRQHR